MLTTWSLWSASWPNENGAISNLNSPCGSSKETRSLLLNGRASSLLSLDILPAIFLCLQLNSIWEAILFTRFVVTSAKVYRIVVAASYIILFTWSKFSVMIWCIIHLVLLRNLVTARVSKLAVIEGFRPRVLELTEVVVLNPTVLLFELTCHRRIIVWVTSSLWLCESLVLVIV